MYKRQLYAVLADKGYFPREDLWTLRKFHSHLQGHPDMRKTPGVDANTGSLGQGVSIAGGMALAAKYKGESHRVFVITGDGESQEGLVWEAAKMCIRDSIRTPGTPAGRCRPWPTGGTAA